MIQENHLDSDQTCGQSYKASTIVIYDSRVVNYERKLFIRLATVLPISLRNGTLVHRLSSSEAAVFHQLQDDAGFPGTGRSGNYDSAIGGKIRRQMIGYFPEQPVSADEILRTADHGVGVGHFEEERLQGPVGLTEPCSQKFLMMNNLKSLSL